MHRRGVVRAPRGFSRPSLRDALAFRAVAARIFEEVVGEFPAVDPAERERIAAGPRGARVHAELEGALGVFRAVEQAPPPARLAEPRELRLTVWNLERGRHVAQSAAVIAATGANVTLLSELDVGMARTGNHHTAREIAGALGHGFVYGVEFLELGLGGPEERERHAGESNALGLHGGAITSALPIARPAVVRLDEGGEWFDGARGEPRVGGRMAVLGTVRAGGVDVTLAAVHLESHTDPAHRAEQVSALLEAVEAYAPGAPAVVAGDLNTMSMPTAHVFDPEHLKPALAEDPERLLRPVRHEPLFERARSAGFDWEVANVLGEGTVRRVEGGGSRRVPVRIDWILTRKVGVAAPAVFEAVDPATGEALSDHEPLAVTIRPWARVPSAPKRAPARPGSSD